MFIRLDPDFLSFFKTIVPFFRSEEDKNLTEDEVQKLKNTADEKKAKYNKARY